VCTVYWKTITHRAALVTDSVAFRADDDVVLSSVTEFRRALRENGRHHSDFSCITRGVRGDQRAPRKNFREFVFASSHELP